MNRAPLPPRAAGLREALLTARIWTFVFVLSLLVRRCSVPRLLRLCALRAPRPPEDDTLVVACVDRVLARHPGMPRSPCLKRSLTLYRFLGGPAADLQFCLGVRYPEAPRPAREPQRLQSHAWLLRGGAPYLELGHPHARRFREIYRHPAREGAA
jgi:hypothetical protein